MTPFQTQTDQTQTNQSHTDQVTTYQDALDYLYRFIDSPRPAPDSQIAAHRLERVRTLLAMLGNPHNAFHALVVAGTKGKGSTCAIIESIIRAAGYRTALWTSPHLNSYRERIQVNRCLIERDALVAAVEHLRLALEMFDTAIYGTPTTFELGFVLALRHFAEQGVQLAVLEVGVGGRYDASNVVTPLLSVITSISYDHMDFLGQTLAEIAYDKAGIIKPGVPALTVPQYSEAADTLRRVAQHLQAPLWVAESESVLLTMPPQKSQINENHPTTPELLTYPFEPVPALHGYFQRENARLAVATSLLLRQQGFAMSDEALRYGLEFVQWPGRMEIARTSPPLVLDGAHNGDSAAKLLHSLQLEFSYQRLILVLGVSRNKDIQAILSVLVPHASVLVLTSSGHPRAEVDLDHMAQRALPYTQGPMLLAPTVAEALHQAHAHARAGDLICVTGSLFVVGVARQLLGLAVTCE